jgi:hypothetical protein
MFHIEQGKVKETIEGTGSIDDIECRERIESEVEVERTQFESNESCDPESVLSGSEGETASDSDHEPVLTDTESEHISVPKETGGSHRSTHLSRRKPVSRTVNRLNKKSAKSIKQIKLKRLCHQCNLIADCIVGISGLLPMATQYETVRKLRKLKGRAERILHVRLKGKVISISKQLKYGI